MRRRHQTQAPMQSDGHRHGRREWPGLAEDTTALIQMVVEGEAAAGQPGSVAQGRPVQVWIVPDPHLRQIGQMTQGDTGQRLYMVAMLTMEGDVQYGVTRRGQGIAQAILFNPYGPFPHRIRWQGALESGRNHVEMNFNLAGTARHGHGRHMVRGGVPGSCAISQAGQSGDGCAHLIGGDQDVDIDHPSLSRLRQYSAHYQGHAFQQHGFDADGVEGANQYSGPGRQVLLVIAFVPPSLLKHPCRMSRRQAVANDLRQGGAQAMAAQSQPYLSSYLMAGGKLGDYGQRRRVEAEAVPGFRR
ncbi:MAG: hypothetical protein FD176_893 [Rhodospirillaceae bacterium]|nr:MAG: hypothetical protein FD176_893 [Rhodospirillaceae bacterium]TNC97842.1 MAG: hypothetical protein FD119_830 [Stygiobacter sp.]